MEIYQDDSNVDIKKLLLENEQLRARLNKFTTIQQSLIKANNIIDKQLDLYKRFSYYNSKIVEAQSLQSFKAIIPEAVIDCFDVESAMVVFDSPGRLGIYHEGFKDVDNFEFFFECAKKFLHNFHERQPVYFNEDELEQCNALKHYSSLLCRKFNVPSNNYTFYILGFVSRKHKHQYKLLNDDQMLIFDNFSEQMHTNLRHRLASRNLKISEEKYRGIIANMQIGLLEVDTNDRILLANRSFCDMSGYSEQELLGNIASDLLLLPKERERMILTNKTRVEYVSSVYEINVVNKKGENRVWLISGAPNIDLDGNLKGSIGIHLDITKQKRVEENLQAANVNLQKINNELDTFVYRVSHDLRTPLVSIISLAEIVMSSGVKSLGDENIKMMNLILKGANRLDNSIKEILNYSRNARLELDISSVNIQQLVLSVYEDIKYVNTDINFVCNFNDIEVIDTDTIRLETILKNLLSNAIKYYDPKKTDNYISFTISETDNHYHIEVVDNGIGMSENSLLKVFEMFYRGASSSEGTGLGMFIVKEIVAKLKGEISVESELGIGTKFKLILPATYDTIKIKQL